jgi:hypothetical protein
MNANRRVEDSLREAANCGNGITSWKPEWLRGFRIGEKEELDVADEVKTWAGTGISGKLPKNSDYLLANRDLSGAPLEPSLLVDNKDKAAIIEIAIEKLIRDAKFRNAPIAVTLARD